MPDLSVSIESPCPIQRPQVAQASKASAAASSSVGRFQPGSNRKMRRPGTVTVVEAGRRTSPERDRPHAPLSVATGTGVRSTTWESSYHR